MYIFECGQCKDFFAASPYRNIINLVKEIHARMCKKKVAKADKRSTILSGIESRKRRA